MALTSTTLSVACTATEDEVTLTSVSGLVVGMRLLVNDEWMTVNAIDGYEVAVERGVGGTLARAHGILSIAVFGYPYDFHVRPRPKHLYTYGESGAITKEPGVHTIAKAGVAAMTLKAPVADDEGIQLLIISKTAYAHTVTLDSGTFNNETHSEVLVFGGAIGDCIVLEVVGGYWCVALNKNITLPSVSASVSASRSASVSASVSPSVSASVSASRSASVSASVSESTSASAT